MPYIHANPPAGITASAEDFKRAMHLDRMRHLATMAQPETRGNSRRKAEVLSSVYHTPIGQHASEYAQQASEQPYQPSFAEWAAPAEVHHFAAPNHAQAARTYYEPQAFALTPGPFHAPATFDNRVPTPHDTYRYPVANREPVYVPQESESSKKDRLNDALSAYYVTEVTRLLVEPGQYRPGVGGQSEEIWGTIGREREEYERVGLPVPDRSQAGYWGRMGMAVGPVAMPSPHRARTLQYEPYDPYRLLQHRHHPRPTVIAFVKDILTRMTISPTAVITALWYLKGLGLHSGDGDKGEILRGYLHEARDEDGVLKRVVVLGLVLAGKWLDDNSFLTKSWNEVTRLPIRLIDTFERVALKDFHYSLHIPLPSWIEHITSAHITLLTDNAHSHTATIEKLLDQMIGEARDALLNDPLNWVIDNDFQYASSTPSRDWRNHSRSHSMQSQEAPEWTGTEDLSIDIEAERNVAALVADDEVLMDEEEDEYDFVEYDGAKPWLPTMSDLRRSHSNSSAVSQDESLSQWRLEHHYASNHHANSSVTEIEQLVTQPSMSQYESSYDHDCSQCYSQVAHVEADAPWSSPLFRAESRDAFEEDEYLEPGIAVVRPAAPVDHSVPSTVSSATATMTGYPPRDQSGVQVPTDLASDHYDSVEAYDRYDNVPEYDHPQHPFPHARHPEGDYKAYVASDLLGQLLTPRPITNPYNFTYTPPSYHQYPFRE